MKNLVIGLIVLGLTNLTIAQSNQYAQNERFEEAEIMLRHLNSIGNVPAISNVPDKSTKNEHLMGVEFASHNLTYISNVLDTNTPSQIKNLEAMATRYDITKHPKFNKLGIDEFGVVFEQSNARITAFYDNDGRIVKSYEKFKNVILPKNLVKQIMVEYPGWEFRSNTYFVKYNSGKDAKKHYKLQLIKDNNKVNIKVDSSGNII